MAMNVTMTAERRAEELAKPLVPVRTAGMILGLTITATYKAADNGDIPTVTINNRRYAPTARLREMIEGRVGQPEKAA